jgi:coenzyme F420-0:L-glutamate ligase/coenzyme F420-1:gamma-L-glutamate ligase
MSKGVWATDITVTAIHGFPLVSPGCDVVEVTLFCLSEQDTAIESGDIFVFTQKIVSKAEGRAVNLKNVNPGPQAKQLSSETGKDPRLVELILSESKEIVRQAPDLIVAAHRLGEQFLLIRIRLALQAEDPYPFHSIIVLPGALD